MLAYQRGSWKPEGFARSEKATFSQNSKLVDDLKLPAAWQNAGTLTVASGEVFVAANRYREQLATESGMGAVDMNLFGLLSAYADHEVPLVNWRIVSDHANDQANEDFQKFVAGYDGSGGKWLAEVIRTLPANPHLPESYPKLRQLLEKKQAQ